MRQEIKPARRRSSILFILIIFMVFPGCAELARYGKVYPVEPGDRVTIRELEKNWEDYDIYYAGISIGNPLGILFDPRKDEKTLVADLWTRVTDQETLKEALTWINARRIHFSPMLRKIIGPDNQIYGYIYTAIDHVVTKSINEKTLNVYIIQDPAMFERWENRPFS